MSDIKWRVKSILLFSVSVWEIYENFKAVMHNNLKKTMPLLTFIKSAVHVFAYHIMTVHAV